MLRKGKIILAVVAMLLTVALVAQAATSMLDMQNSVVIDGTDPESPYATWQSNRFTHVQNTANGQVIHDLNGFKLAAENDNLALYIREEDTAIRVLNKKNGYVWGALNAQQSEELGDGWSSFGNSLVSIEYINDGGSIPVSVGAGHSSANFTLSYSGNKIICDVGFPRCGIYLKATAELKDDHIEFSVDDKSVKETNPEYYLQKVYFAPFLGATTEDEISGYSFVPDGCGALMRYKAQGDYIQGYEKRIYGLDYAIDSDLEANSLNSTRPNDFMKSEETVTLPVYGLTHGYKQNAIFGLVNGAAEYATIWSSPSGNGGIVQNWTTAYFTYHQYYFQRTTRDGVGVNVMQENRNHFTPKLSLYFLTGDQADYIGMASLYRDILEENNGLPEKLADTSTIAVDFIMEDVKKGFFTNSAVEISSIDYIEKSIKALDENGVDDIHLTLLGWQKGGLHGYSKSDVFYKGTFGSFSKLDTLKDILKDGDLSLYIDYLRAREPQLKESKDAAISLSQLPITTKRDDLNAFLGTTYFLKYPASLTSLATQAKILREDDLNSLVIDGGNLLYGEYLTDAFASRTNVRDFAEKIFGTLAKKDKLTVFNPNDYLLAYVSEYRDAPMNSSQFIFEDDTVPFLQIVLSGKIAMFAPYANDSFYSKTSVLKCIEYNCYPSFILTEKSNYEIKETAVSDYSSTQFEDWKDTMVEIHGEINGILSKVKGEEITNHNVVDDGVVVVTYETGSVLINYKSTDYVWQGVEIPALSAVYQAI